MMTEIDGELSIGGPSSEQVTELRAKLRYWQDQLKVAK